MLALEKSASMDFEENAEKERMNQNELKKTFPHASASFIKANAVDSLAEISGPISQPAIGKALVGKTSGKRTRRSRVIGSHWRTLLRVGLVACHNRGPQKDSHDNLPASFKQLADAIAVWFGCDDSEIDWWYGQVQWHERGTIVIVQPAKIVEEQ